MFKTLAKSGLVDFRFAGFRPRVAGFSNNSLSNDNLPGFRRPKGRRRIPTPALVCHWIIHNGRLECRWQAEPGDDKPLGCFDEHGATDRSSGPRPTQSRGHRLALAG
jgi:hypothetical protein